MLLLESYIWDTNELHWQHYVSCEWVSYTAIALIAFTIDDKEPYFFKFDNFLIYPPDLFLLALCEL